MCVPLSNGWIDGFEVLYRVSRNRCGRLAAAKWSSLLFFVGAVSAKHHKQSEAFGLPHQECEKKKKGTSGHQDDEL